MLIKTENKMYARDSKTRSLVSIDAKTRDDYKSKRALLQKSKDNEKDISDMKQDITEIKEILGTFIDLMKQNKTKEEIK